jgi:phosphatidylglycerophosphate synthase
MPGWALDLFWLAAAITVWTGLEYALAARKALKTQP